MSRRARYIVGCSFGKDSLATVITAVEHGEPLDEAVYCEVMFDEHISGEYLAHGLFYIRRERGREIAKRGLARICADKRGGAMSGPIYGRTCEGCEHVIAEKWVKGKTAHRCNAPGPCRGYVVGQEHFIPYIPAWCPELINKKEGSTK